MRKAYAASKVFTGDEWLEDHLVICSDGKIISVEKNNGQEKDAESFEGFIAPAFIDLQIYGASGRLIGAYPDSDSLSALVKHNTQSGTVLCLPTIATNTSNIVFDAIDAVRNYNKSGRKGIGGIHLEGPWINPVKRGAHIESLIHPPGAEEVKELLKHGKGIIKMITLAPEICTTEIANLIRSAGIIISAGHSNATYDQAKRAFGEYATTITHLFNAMSAFGHRAPGLAGAALDDDQVMASIIPDGYHVDYSAIRIAKKVMRERLFAITDAVTETKTGPYQHYPAGDKYESNGILSGSALTMNKAAYNLVNHAGIETGEALRMCSLYPAKVIGIDKEYGKIKPGYNTSMVVLDDHFEVIQLISDN